MKKIALYLFACITVSFASCSNEIENWNSAAFDYAGRFVVSATCSENPAKNATVEKGNEIHIYNSAANIDSEIWLDDVSGKFPLKCKFSLNGSSTLFSSVSGAENIKKVYHIYNSASGKYIKFISANKDDFPVATAAGQTNAGVSEYVRADIQEGKILPKAATSPGGNTVDSVYIALLLHSETIRFVSAAVPEADWKTPGVPEYEWTVQNGSGAADPSRDEHWTVAGYRYTGYPEDM